MGQKHRKTVKTFVTVPERSCYEKFRTSADRSGTHDSHVYSPCGQWRINKKETNMAIEENLTADSGGIGCVKLTFSDAGSAIIIAWIEWFVNLKDVNSKLRLRDIKKSKSLKLRCRMWFAKRNSNARRTRSNINQKMYIEQIYTRT